MIKVKIQELIDSVETLKKLAQRDFKAKLAWSISRLLKSAETEIQAFNEARLNLINKYGVKDENNQLITDDKGNCRINPNDIAVFTDELNELISSEVEINANKIDIEALENIDFTPQDMAVLEPFINMEE